MKKNIFTRIIAIALVAMSIMAIAIPAFALSGSYYHYLGGDGTSDYIRRGHTGDKVKNLQILLNAFFDQDTPLVVDGIFGSKTAKRVKAFQAYAFGNDPDYIDGIVGPATKYALWNEIDTMPSDLIYLN